MNKNDFNKWLNGFKEVNKPKTKQSIQTKFDLDFTIRKKINSDKIGYQIPNKIRKQFKKISDKIE